MNNDKELTFSKTIPLWGTVVHHLIPKRTVLWSQVGEEGWQVLLREVKEHGCEYSIAHTTREVVEVGS